MNPFDLKGPQFLAFWILGLGAVGVVILILRAAIARSRNTLSLEQLADELHPTELAYLVGGIERAIEAAVIGLEHRGYLEIDPTSLVRASGKQGSPVIAENGVFRGVVVDEELSRVEKFVMQQVPATVRDMCGNAGPVDIVIKQKLIEQGLLVNVQPSTRLLLFAPALFWVGVGFIKVFIGISRDKPVGFLIILVLIAFVGSLAVIKAPRLTSTGRRLDAHLRERYSALEATAKTAPSQLDGTDMTLAYALFGYIVAPALFMSALPSYHTAQLAATSSASSSCSSGCGSSCGGGCGGGCGGCG